MFESLFSPPPCGEVEKCKAFFGRGAVLDLAPPTRIASLSDLPTGGR